MKKIFILAVAIVITFAFIGCDGTSKIASSTVLDQERRAPYDTTITQSLFDDRDRTISEENIQRLLNGRINLPDTIRIAIHRFSKSPVNRYYYSYWTDEDFLKTQQAFIDVIVNSLTKSKRVKKVILIPAMMMSTKPTITNLRETAVRLQCDLLLVFSVTSDLYYKYKFLNKDEAKAFATTESMLLDTRTGVVPFSYVVTKDYLTKKTGEDMNQDELRKRAEQQAIVESLIDTGDKLKDFLEQKN